MGRPVVPGMYLLDLDNAGRPTPVVIRATKPGEVTVEIDATVLDEKCDWTGKSLADLVRRST